MPDDGKSDSRQRTEWSEDRTIMANERTFSSWCGAGMGALGVAIGLKAVFGAVDPTWAAKLVATIFVVIAVAIFQAARRNACMTFQRLTESDVEVTPTRNFTAIAHGLSVGAIAIAGLLWSL